MCLCGDFRILWCNTGTNEMTQALNDSPFTIRLKHFKEVLFSIFQHAHKWVTHPIGTLLVSPFTLLFSLYFFCLVFYFILILYCPILVLLLSPALSFSLAFFSQVYKSWASVRASVRIKCPIRESHSLMKHIKKWWHKPVLIKRGLK